MERWLGKFSDAIYSLARFVIGVLFACHGAQKLFGAFGGIGVPLNPMLKAAGFIEFFGGCLIALGLAAGYVAFIASGEMAAAYFMVHAPGGLWPIVNKGEPAVMYCFIFLYIASRGSGRFSIDALIRPHRS